MSRLDRADRDPNHLYPAFRTKVLQVLECMEDVTGVAWMIVEGYRSAERQLWLYGQGRTRPGRKVTWKRTPTWHGTGLAADLAPRKDPYGAPPEYWRLLAKTIKAHGLDNPAHHLGDYGHVQLTDYTVRQKALAWVRAGFPASDPRPPDREILVTVDGELIPDADGDLRDGAVWVALRPVCDALDLTITSAGDSLAAVADEDQLVHAPLKIQGGRGFSPVRALEPFTGYVRWDENAKTVRIRTKD